ncbi:MAG: magnesium transporter [Clostridia bacterium]|nr:magnesium transporter [Clostridia bacterium]
MIDRVLELLRSRQYVALKQLISDMHEADIAEVFSEISDRDSMLRFFRLLPKQTAADVFTYLEPDIQQKIIEAITDVELRSILDDMFLDDCVDLIEEMPANVVQRVLRNTPKDERALINRYLQYPEDSAGSLMTNEYVSLKKGMTAAEALKEIRLTGVDKETIETCFIVSRDRKLEGEVTLREIVLADPDTLVDDLSEDYIISVQTHTDREEVANLFSKYDVTSIPVVDQENRLVGVITIDDAIDVIVEENTEDFEKMAGMNPSDETYLKTPVWQLARNRIVWLLVLMVSAMLTGAMLEHYEAAIAAIPLLVSFIPMLMDTGGNCGSQASTMIIRGLALGEIEGKDLFRVWWKEIRVALLCGAVLATVNFIRISLQYHDIGIAAVVCSTLVCTILIAKSLGCLLPMLAKSLKVDPALMASPMITTITDAASILVFFRFALAFLSERL